VPGLRPCTSIVKWAINGEPMMAPGKEPIYGPSVMHHAYEWLSGMPSCVSILTYKWSANDGTMHGTNTWSISDAPRISMACQECHHASA